MGYYPTRMHEILGVEPGEVFCFDSEKYKYMVSDQGYLLYDKFGVGWADVMSIDRLTEIINHPDRIVRKPRLTLKQISKLKALYELDMRWLIRTSVVLATHGEPTKIKGSWVYKWDGPFIDVYKLTNCLDVLDYTYPINIAQILEDNDVPFIKDPC